MRVCRITQMRPRQMANYLFLYSGGGMSETEFERNVELGQSKRRRDLGQRLSLGVVHLHGAPA